MDERQKPVVTSKVQSTSRVSGVSYGSGVEEGYSSQMRTRNLTLFLIIGKYMIITIELTSSRAVHRY